MEENQQVRLKYYIRWYFILGKSVGKIGLSQLLEWHLMEYGMHVKKNSWRMHWYVPSVDKTDVGAWGRNRATKDRKSNGVGW